MPLSGTFDVLDFSDVMHLVADHELTGRLYVRTRHCTANLFWDAGKIIGADQSEHQAAAVVGDVWTRLEETCFELLEAERGSFEFQTGKTTSTEVTHRLNVDEVLDRATARKQEWQELQALIPTLDLVPRLVNELEPAEVTVDRDRWRMLTVIDGRRNLRTIARALDLTDFDVCRMCRTLIENGLIDLEGRVAAIASAAIGSEAERPPITETVTTATGRQAVRASAPIDPLLKADSSADGVGEKGAEAQATSSPPQSPVQPSEVLVTGATGPAPAPGGGTVSAPAGTTEPSASDRSKESSTEDDQSSATDKDGKLRGIVRIRSKSAER